MKNRMMLCGVLCASLAFVAPPTFAAEAGKAVTGEDLKNAKPSGTVDVDAEQVRLILGGSSGKGVLHFKGKNYPFTFKGGSVGGVGVTKVQATGEVYFLNRVEDFAGTYSAATAGAALGKGGGRSSFQNDKGVYLSLRSKTEGVALNLGLAVATVELVK